MSSPNLDEEELQQAQEVVGSDFAFLGDVPRIRGGQQKHRDAVDYEDFDELADDESLPEEEIPSRAMAGNEDEDYEALIGDARVVNDDEEGLERDGVGSPVSSPPNRKVGVKDSGLMESLIKDEEDGRSDLKTLDGNVQQAALPGMSQEELLHNLYPYFMPHEVLRFNELFAMQPSDQTQRWKAPKVTVPSRLALETGHDDRRYFRSATTARPKALGQSHIVHMKDSKVGTDSTPGLRRNMLETAASFEHDLLLACSDWDSELVWDDEIQSDEHVNKRARLSNTHTIDAAWLNEDLIFEGYLPSKGKVLLDLNDPNLLVDKSFSTSQINGTAKRKHFGGKQMAQPFNLSNDEAYDLLKENYRSKVRSVIGQLSIEHSMVALRLQSPYYKTRLSKAEARSFHRPSISFPLNTEIRFTKMKSRKKKKDKGKDIRTIFNTTKDLSLSDNSTSVLIEYSEEYPYVLSNVGMGSRIVNYYRKHNERDTSRPKLEIGETHVLDLEDRSPFWNFGFVNSGETVPTLYNNLVRAPIFKHDPEPVDFLVLRSSSGKKQNYYLRTISHLFVAGQLFPVIEVPGPQSRKVTTAGKNRLRMIVFRILKKRGNGRLLVRDVAPHFPDQNDMQNRQRLKEFMEYQRSGIDSNFWTLKEPLPTNDAIRSMISPETVCLIDSVQVGQRHLEDAGYGKTVEDNEDESKMSVDQKLAPWIATRNLIHATQGKAMLELHGEGDPTGRGEGVSFIKTSMKGGFKPIDSSDERPMETEGKGKGVVHAYNVAKQQKAYEDHIKSIWNAQRTSLSVTRAPALPELNQTNLSDVDSLFETQTPRSDVASPYPGQEVDDDMMSASSHGRNKVMRITRMIRDAHGNLERKTEVVTDPNVIRSYRAARHTIEDAALEAEKMEPTDDAGRNARMIRLLEQELVRLNRNKDRRLARKEQKEKQKTVNGDSTSSPASPGTPGAFHPDITKPQKPVTSRKCAHCGQVGHIKTNRKCPRYHEFYNEKGEPRIRTPLS